MLGKLLFRLPIVIQLWVLWLSEMPRFSSIWSGTPPVIMLGVYPRLYSSPRTQELFTPPVIWPSILRVESFEGGSLLLGLECYSAFTYSPMVGDGGWKECDPLARHA